MNEEPCNSFNQWLERNPYYKEHFSEEMLQTLCNVWNAGWNEGWKRMSFWLKKTDGPV